MIFIFFLPVYFYIAPFWQPFPPRAAPAPQRSGRFSSRPQLLAVPGVALPGSRCSSRGAAGAGTPRSRQRVARVALVAGAGHACPLACLGWSGSRTRGLTQRLRNWSPPFVYPLYISQTWKLRKGEIYEENLISHSCWMDLVWYWPDFTMCLLKALEYILYVKDCNNFKKNSW